MLDRFNMSKAKELSTPLAWHLKMNIKTMSYKGERQRKNEDFVVYSSMYVMGLHQALCAHVVGNASLYLSNYGKEHWNVVK